MQDGARTAAVSKNAKDSWRTDASKRSVASISISAGDSAATDRTCSTSPDRLPL